MVGVVILNYNNWDITYKCLDSLLSSYQKNRYLIYLIDNNSSIEMSDKVKIIIENRKDKINFLRNTENKGYSAGNNLGIKQALDDQCDYILVSNNDIFFKKNVIDELVEAFMIDDSIGIVAPLLLDINGLEQNISMCMRTNYSDKLIYRTPLRHFFSKKKLLNYYIYPPYLDKYYKVHAASGACFMVSRRCALDITPLDENTFLYEEELIIGVVMENKCYQTIILPLTKVVHAEGQTTKLVKAFSYIEFVKSEIYYCRIYLNVGRVRVFILFFIRFISYVFRCLKSRDYRKYFNVFFRDSMKKILSRKKNLGGIK